MNNTRLFHLHFFFYFLGSKIHIYSNVTRYVCVPRWIIFRAKLNRFVALAQQPTKFDRAERESTGRKISKIFILR